MGIPGLDFPGYVFSGSKPHFLNSDYLRVLTIGPSFEVTALARADLNASIELRANLSFTTEGTTIAFPPSVDTPVQGIKPGNSSTCLFFSPYRFILAEDRIQVSTFLPPHP